MKQASGSSRCYTLNGVSRNHPYHYDTFTACGRREGLAGANAKPIEGNRSSALSYYALTGARVNRVLEIDPETEMVKNDDEANTYLTREYRAPFTVPAEV